MENSFKNIFLIDKKLLTWAEILEKSKKTVANSSNKNFK